MTAKDPGLSRTLKVRLDAAWEGATNLAGVPDDTFWATMAPRYRELAEVYGAIRAELNPEPGSVLRRALLDAQTYRAEQAREAGEIAGASELRGED